MALITEKLPKHERTLMALLAFAIVIVLRTRTAAAESNEPLTGAAISGFVTVSGPHFIDGAKTPLVLHGINVINKSKSEGYTKNIERSDLHAIRRWGMNCIRLGILWDGLEPKPGQVDEEYLDRIARIVDWAKAEGLYVLLDMHQDLYSVKFSDGAPPWATLDEGKPYTPTTVWSDAYYTSEAVQLSLDHFWDNSPAPDGLALQDHYARVWRSVAKRFREEPAVLGYDVMNEPFPGRDNARCRAAMISKLVELLPARLGANAPSATEFAAVAGTPQGRQQFTEWLSDKELFSALLTAGTPIMQSFERDRLQLMYQRVVRTIREVDSQHIIFLEPATSANIGVPSAIAPLVDERGRRDLQQAYAPHAYDIVTDTPLSGPKSSSQRVELIFGRHSKKAEDLKMPLLIGEWGAYYGDASAADAARFIVRQLDVLHCGDMYWAYRRDLQQSPLLRALERTSTNAAAK